MESSPQESSSQNFFFFVALFIGLFVLWVVTGGPERTTPTKLFDTTSSRGEIRDASVLGIGDVAARKKVGETIFDVQEKVRKLKKEMEQARIKGTSSPYEGMVDRKSTRLNSSHTDISRMPSSA